MNLFDLITQEEIDELPEESNLAFMEFVRHCQRRLAQASNELSGIDENDWRIVQDYRQSFMNIVLAASKRFEVEPFASRSVPYKRGFDGNDYDNFISDLDHFMTQLVLDRSMRSRSSSTSIPTTTRDRIKSHLYHLREAVRSAKIDDAKKGTLLKKIDDFEAALEKNRLPLMALATLSVSILSMPGALWASYEVTSKLITNIIQAVGEAKVQDDEQRKLPSTPEPYVIAPPRPREEKRSREPDDEIPF